MTIAKIFLGKISNWDDPAISADNGGVVLPNQHITVVCRTGQSGTTALFYDFIAHTDPSDFASWAAQNGFSTGSRILEVDNVNSPTNMACQAGSDTEANYIAANRWTIGYDEFSYAKIYNDNVAWIQNQSGNWVQPYAGNIAAALQSAVLAPDTSQDLSGVYTSTNPLAYPISAYSYILVQCAPTSSRARRVPRPTPIRALRARWPSSWATSPAPARSIWPKLATHPSRHSSRSSSRTQSGGCWANRHNS